VRAQTQPASADPPQSDVAAQLEQARQLNNAGKQDEALAIVDHLLASDPKSYEANLTAGTLLDLKGSYDQARTYLQQAIDVAPAKSKIQALRTMAVSYAFQCNLQQVGNYEQQAYDMQMKEQKFTDAAGTANELARIDLECGDVKAAGRWYQTGYDTAMRTTSLSEADHDLWTFRWENAQARIAAREANRKQAEGHVAAAKGVLDKGKIPDQQRFYPYLTGYVAFYAGEYQAAVDQLQTADQKDPFILVLMAQAYEKLGNQAEATKYYRQVLTVNSHSPTNAFARPLATKKLAS
jgi:tetratricopeptide (TPR) repeat protein